MKPKSLKEMRQAAQNAQQERPYKKESDELADAVTQLCDEVEMLRSALDYYANGKNWYGPGAPFNEDKSRKMIIASMDTEGHNWLGGRTARTALKESNERLKE